MSEETNNEPLVEKPFPDGPTPETEAKPVGPATVVGEDPIEQFPPHIDNA